MAKNMNLLTLSNKDITVYKPVLIDEKQVSITSKYNEKVKSHSRSKLLEWQNQDEDFFYSVLKESQQVKHYKIVGQHKKTYKPKDLTTIECLHKLFRPRVIYTSGLEVTVFNIAEISRKNNWEIVYRIDETVIEISSAKRVKKVHKNHKNLAPIDKNKSIKQNFEEYYLRVLERIVADFQNAYPLMKPDAINYKVNQYMMRMSTYDTIDNEKIKELIRDES